MVLAYSDPQSLEAAMKLLVFVLGVIFGVAAIETPAGAQNYPWCAQYSGGGGANCGFTTYAQCMASASGLGSCVQNTQYQPPSPAARQRPVATTSHQVPQKPHQNLVAPQPQ